MLLLRLSFVRFLSLEMIKISDILFSERFNSVRLGRKQMRWIYSILLQLNVNSVVPYTNSQLTESKFLFKASSHTSGGTFIYNRSYICCKSSISSNLEEPKCFSRSSLLLSALFGKSTIYNFQEEQA
ncbi:Hypothetical_protein [Hexamita inflata]|uniref:Hypothetical_protein n=1 Tax=Hexamita inflata TaxID=28002 RepID=A0AA86R051_9EUKA|nr:Hypothetical protein HINF_LOCUS55415 [Hexamita inflata]